MIASVRFIRRWDWHPRRKPDFVSRLRTNALPSTSVSFGAEVANERLDPTSAYVHLPFCKRRCHYCDFPIHVLGSKETETTVQVVSEYVQLLCKEINQTPKMNCHPLRTAFFGGGTPSLIPPHELSCIIRTLQWRFGFGSEIEMSLEADPGTFDSAKMEAYLSLGVNRVSLGVQSFDDHTLQLCGRSHSVADVWAAIEIIRQMNMRSWSMDLISGLPHVTLETWKETLSTAIDCHPDHVSIYDLQIEPSTAFHRWYEAEKLPLPPHEISAEMYALASSMLTEAGYEHYEISNYAKPGHRCKHNMTYWRNRHFYGFGLGAASYLRRKRAVRPKKMSPYRKWVDGDSHEAIVVDDGDDMFDTVMLQLRLKDGISLREFSENFGSEALSKLQTAVEDEINNGRMECVDCTTRRINWDGSWEEVANVRLTDPNGFLLSNDVLSTIFTKLSLGDS